MFFASTEACAASLMFNKGQCNNAFVNAASELRRNAGDAMTKAECRRRFQMCERRNGSDALYAPVMLGVELLKSARGWRAIPLLAVELRPGQLQAQPISHVAPEPAEFGRPNARPDTSSPEWLAPITAAFLDEIKSASSIRAQQQTERERSKRRDRLRNAPLITY